MTTKTKSELVGLAKAEMIARIECLDDHESITLRVTSTVGESGIDVSTDGSADATDGVRIEVQVSRTSDRGVRQDWTICALGQTLADALAGSDPRWLECPDLVQLRRVGSSSDVGESALDRLVPGWADGLVEARLQLQAEADAGYDDEGDDLNDGDEAWMAEVENRSGLSWFALAQAPYAENSAPLTAAVAGDETRDCLGLAVHGRTQQNER
jgi:hypothetical protein